MQGLSIHRDVCVKSSGLLWESHALPKLCVDQANGVCGLQATPKNTLKKLRGCIAASPSVPAKNFSKRLISSFSSSSAFYSPPKFRKIPASFAGEARLQFSCIVRAYTLVKGKVRPGLLKLEMRKVIARGVRINVAEERRSDCGQSNAHPDASRALEFRGIFRRRIREQSRGRRSCAPRWSS